MVRSAKSNAPCQALVDRNAIEQDLGVLAAQSARKNRRQLAGCSGLNNGEPWHLAQSIAHAFDLFLLQILRRDHARAGGRLVERNVETRRCNDNRLSFRFAREGVGDGS